jgi:hypothetical protein
LPFKLIKKPSRAVRNSQFSILRKGKSLRYRPEDMWATMPASQLVTHFEDFYCRMKNLIFI